MPRTTALVLISTAALAAAAPATSRIAEQVAAPKPCSTTKLGGATIVNWCGPARATVKLAGKTLPVKGGVCGISSALGEPVLAVNVGKFTVPPTKPKFAYFGLVGKRKPGAYSNGEHTISFQVAGKAYSVMGGPIWGIPWPKVTIAAGAKKGTFSGRAFLGASGKGVPVNGSWSC